MCADSDADAIAWTQALQAQVNDMMANTMFQKLVLGNAGSSGIFAETRWADRILARIGPASGRQQQTATVATLGSLRFTAPLGSCLRPRALACVQCDPV